MTTMLGLLGGGGYMLSRNRSPTSEPQTQHPVASTVPAVRVSESRQPDTAQEPIVKEPDSPSKYQWQRYINKRPDREFSVLYPIDWLTLKEAANGDGLQIETTDTGETILIYSSLNMETPMYSGDENNILLNELSLNNFTSLKEYTLDNGLLGIWGVKTSTDGKKEVKFVTGRKGVVVNLYAKLSNNQYERQRLLLARIAKSVKILR